MKKRYNQKLNAGIITLAILLGSGGIAAETNTEAQGQPKVPSEEQIAKINEILSGLLENSRASGKPLSPSAGIKAVADAGLMPQPTAEQQQQLDSMDAKFQELEAIRTDNTLSDQEKQEKFKALAEKDLGELPSHEEMEKKRSEIEAKQKNLTASAK